MEIKVYSTPTCPYCIRVKNFLKERQVPFTNVDVSVDQAGLKEMIKISGQMGVPVVVMDGDVIVGFDQGRIEAKLGR